MQITVANRAGDLTSTPNDLNIVVQDLSLQRQENDMLQQNLKHIEAQKIKNYSLLVQRMQNSHQFFFPKKKRAFY